MTLIIFCMSLAACFLSLLTLHFNSFCCLSASAFSCAFSSVLRMFRFCVQLSSPTHVLCCDWALMSLFCVPLFLLSVILFAVSFEISAHLPKCVGY